MLGLVLLYFVGKAFYDLAGRHARSQWGFAIIGVISYYAGIFLGQILLLLIYGTAFSGSIDDVNDIVIGLLSIPFGVLACWGLYKSLENSWEKSPISSVPDDVIDAELPRDDNQ